MCGNPRLSRFLKQVDLPDLACLNFVLFAMVLRAGMLAQ
jgi:hypothetical protein